MLARWEEIKPDMKRKHTKQPGDPHALVYVRYDSSINLNTAFRNLMLCGQNFIQ